MNDEVKKEIKKLHRERAKAKKELRLFCKFLLKNASPQLIPAQG